MICLGVDFLSLSYLGLLNLDVQINVFFKLNLGCFWLLFLQILFMSLSVFFSEALFDFLKYPLCSSDWIISTAVSLNSLIISSAGSNMLLNPSSKLSFNDYDFQLLNFHQVLFIEFLYLYLYSLFDKPSYFSFILKHSFLQFFVHIYNSCFGTFAF